jgi:hypothetical protein
MNSKERCRMLIDEVRILKAENFALIERNNNQFKIITDLNARLEELEGNMKTMRIAYSKFRDDISATCYAHVLETMQELEKKGMK